MKIIKKILATIVCFCLAILVCSCNKVIDKETFVGVAIYQNLEINTNWNSIKNNPELINNYISTEENKLIYNEKIPFLFYIYSKNEININNLPKDNFETNTTIKDISFSHETLKFEFERILEDTDILIYFIYKTNSGYKLKYQTNKDDIIQDETTINIETNETNFKTVSISLLKFGTIKKEY